MAGTPPEPPATKAIAWLVASFATVTALIAAFGAAPGTVVDRTLNNHPDGMRFAFIAALVAIVLAVLAYVWTSKREQLVVLSLLAFTVGILLLVFLFTSSRIAKESPTVRAALKSATTLTLEVTAKAAGLTSEEQMFVYAYGLRVTQIDDEGTPTEFGRELLYTSQTGPDKAGAVDLAFEVPVPVGRYYSIGVAPSLQETRSLCTRDELSFLPTDATPTASPAPVAERKPACLVIRIPATSPRPELFGALESTDGAEPRLKIDVEAASLGVGQRLLVHVMGLGTNVNHPIPMYHAVLGPDAAGTIEGAIELRVSPLVSVVCVQAAPLGLVVRSATYDPHPPKLACPERINSLSTTLRIPV